MKMRRREMKTVVQINFSDAGLHGQAVQVPPSLQGQIIKSDVFISQGGRSTFRSSKLSFVLIRPLTPALLNPFRSLLKRSIYSSTFLVVITKLKFWLIGLALAGLI